VGFRFRRNWSGPTAGLRSKSKKLLMICGRRLLQFQSMRDIVSAKVKVDSSAVVLVFNALF